MSEVTLPETSQAVTSSEPGAARRALRHAGYIFWLMFIINFLNYLDRFIFTGLSPTIQQDLLINDFEIGLLGSAFLVVYTLVAMPLGFLADRRSRKGIVGLGVAIWSLASAFTGLVSNFALLLGIRAALGVGEGSYYPAGTPMLAAQFPPSRRARILAQWSVGALIGAAVGFLLAAPFEKPGLWRYAFFFTGIPGLIFAFLIWRTREKFRHEDDPPANHLEGERPSFLSRARSYLRIPTVRALVGMHAFGFFALTAVTGFFPIYLNATYGREVAKLDQFGKVIGTTPGPFPTNGLDRFYVPILAGAIVLLGGIVGNLFGSRLADRLSHRTSRARVLTAGIGFLLAAPCVLAAIGAPYVLNLIPAYSHAPESTRVISGIAIFAVFALAGSFFLNFYSGPASAALLDVIPSKERSSAGGMVLTLEHLLGDVYAAAAVGGLATLLTRWLGGEQIGLALLLTCPAVLVISGIIGIRGSRHYASDVAALGSSAAALLGTKPVAD